MRRSEVGVDRFVCHDENAEDTFVDAVEGFAYDKAFKGCDAESELVRGERPLLATAALVGSMGYPRSSRWTSWVIRSNQ